MSERPYSDDTIFSDTMHGISHDQTYPRDVETDRVATETDQNIGSQAVRGLIPPVLDWGPEQANTTREQEPKTPDGLNFSA